MSNFTWSKLLHKGKVWSWFPIFSCQTFLYTMVKRSLPKWLRFDFRWVDLSQQADQQAHYIRTFQWRNWDSKNLKNRLFVEQENVTMNVTTRGCRARENLNHAGWGVVTFICFLIMQTAWFDVCNALGESTSGSNCCCIAISLTIMLCTWVLPDCKKTGRPSSAASVTYWQTPNSQNTALFLPDGMP